MKQCFDCGTDKPLKDFSASQHALETRGLCRVCQTRRRREWKLKNPGRDLVAERKRRAENPAALNAKQRDYNARNKERVKEINRRSRELHAEQRSREARERREANLDVSRARGRASYAKFVEQRRIDARETYQRNKQDPAWLEKVRRRGNDSNHRYRTNMPRCVETVGYTEILLSDPCSYCGKTAKTIDHIMPLSKGGAHRWDNLTPACKSCNSSKGNKKLMHFLARRREFALAALRAGK